MSGNTVTHRTGVAAERPGTTRAASVAPNRAARELGLRRSELDLAVHLGRVRTVPDRAGGGGESPATRSTGSGRRTASPRGSGPVSGPSEPRRARPSCT